MAITSFNIPSQYQPAFNKCVLTFESDKIAETGFRFILKIADNLFNEIARLSIPPRFGDGLGYADISKIVQSRLSYYSPLNIALFQDGIKPQYDIFRFLIGEEYQIPYTYSNVLQNGLYVQLNGISATTFIAGDQININQSDGGASMPQVQGLFTVVSVAGNDVTISLLWTSIVASGIGGSVTYVDGRKSQLLDQEVETINMFNSAFSFKKFQSYLFSDYLPADGLVKLPFSNLPFTGFKIRPTQDLYIWSYFNELSGNKIRIDYRAFSSSGIEFRCSSDVDTVSFGQMIKVAGDLTGASVSIGALPFIKETTTRIEVRIRTIDGVLVMPMYTIDIDNSCAIEDYEILFLDRLGSWGSFNFPLKSKGNIKSIKKGYQQELGTIEVSGLTYELDSVGHNVYNASASEDLEITTGVLNDVMSEYFEELITSPKCFIKIDGDYFGCEIVSDSTPIERLKNKRLIRKTIQVRLANNIEING